VRHFFSWLFAPRRRGCVLFLATIILVVGWVVTSPFRGMLMSYIDHLRGHEGVCIGGPPPPWWREEGDLLRERYGVEVKGVFPDYITPFTLPAVVYLQGYDSISRDLLRGKYGKDVVSECERDAIEQWRAAHPEEYRRMFGDAPRPR
jgi:hypothetical protein